MKADVKKVARTARRAIRHLNVNVAPTTLGFDGPSRSELVRQVAMDIVAGAGVPASVYAQNTVGGQSQIRLSIGVPDHRGEGRDYELRVEAGNGKIEVYVAAAKVAEFGEDMLGYPEALDRIVAAMTAAAVDSDAGEGRRYSAASVQAVGGPY